MKPATTTCARPKNIPENSILPQLSLIFQEMTYRSQQKWGLVPNVCMVVGHLEMHPDVCEPAAIAEAKRLPRQTMTFVLDTLEKKNLAIRKPHPSDRRRKTVHLTAKGKRLADHILQDFLDIEKAAVAAIGKTNLETVRRLLESFGDAVCDQNAREFKPVKG